MRTLVLFIPLTLIGCGRTPDCAPGDPLLDTGALESAPTFTLSPSTAAPGEIIISSLQSDQAIDFEAVAEVVIYGEAQPCALQAREDELLITIGIADLAAEGSIDLVLVMENGDAHYVADALQIRAEATGE